MILYKLYLRDFSAPRQGIWVLLLLHQPVISINSQVFFFLCAYRKAAAIAHRLASKESH
jgi:hypothetical protein